MFRTEMGHFWITFENGYQISVFNGFGSYTENHDNLKKQVELEKERNIYEGWNSETVEIAIMDDVDFATKEILGCDDDVIGNVSVNELVEIINKVKNYDRNK